MTDNKERNVYKETYEILAAAIEKAILTLIKAQQKCVKVYVESFENNGIELDLNGFEEYMGFWFPGLPISEEEHDTINRYLEGCRTNMAKKWLAYMEEE